MTPMTSPEVEFILGFGRVIRALLKEASKLELDRTKRQQPKYIIQMGEEKSKI